MREYYQKSWMKVVEQLGSNIYKGLMEYECIVRREKYGDNRVTIPNKISALHSLKYKIVSWNSLIYVGLLLIFILKKKYMFFFIELFIFLLSLAHTFWYSWKNQKKIGLLENLNTNDVVVLREGIERIVKSEELVIGDIVIFKENSFISADLRIISSENIKVDERSITGDKILKDKHETMINHTVASLSDISNILFKGSVIKQGRGTGVVINSGMNTHLGKLLSSLDQYELKKNNVFKEMDAVICKMYLVSILLSVILSFIIPGRGELKGEILLRCIFISTALVYPIIYFSYSKMVIKELAEDNIYLNNLSALNDSSLVKVIFIEKNGSITEEKAEVEKIFCNEKSLKIKDLDKKDNELMRLMDIACITSNIYQEMKCEDDIFGEAYVKCCEAYNLGKNRIVKENKFRFKTEINSTESIRTTVTRNERGYRATSRGSLDKILPKCTSILINGVEHPLTEEEINKIKLADLCLARDGLVTEAMAYRIFNYEPSKEENIESNMVLVGLVGIRNLVVKDIKEDIEGLFDKGILPLLFCEDNKITAEILGRDIGLISSSKEVTSGVELSHMSDEEFYKTVSKCRIFCRLKPEQKLKIIKAFYNDGFKVAVEGETLGDLSVISISNVGIGKAKAPKLLKNICDVHTEGSSIKSLLSLKRKSEKVNGAIEKASFTYMQFIIAQILAMYLYYFIDDGILFSENTVIILNVLLAIPLILLALNIQLKSEVKKNTLIINMIAYILSVSIPIIPMETNTEFVVFVVICVNIIINFIAFAEGKIFNKNNIIGLGIYILITLIGAIMIFRENMIVMNGTLVALMSSFGAIYIVMVRMIKNWQ